MTNVNCSYHLENRSRNIYIKRRDFSDEGFATEFDILKCLQVYNGKNLNLKRHMPPLHAVQVYTCIKQYAWL